MRLWPEKFAVAGSEFARLVKRRMRMASGPSANRSLKIAYFSFPQLSCILLYCFLSTVDFFLLLESPRFLCALMLFTREFFTPSLFFLVLAFLPAPFFAAFRFVAARFVAVRFFAGDFFAAAFFVEAFLVVLFFASVLRFVAVAMCLLSETVFKKYTQAQQLATLFKTTAIQPISFQQLSGVPLPPAAVVAIVANNNCFSGCG